MILKNKVKIDGILYYYDLRKWKLIIDNGITFGIIDKMIEKIEILLMAFFVIVMGILLFLGLPYGFIIKPFLYAGIGMIAGYLIGKKGK